MHYYSAFFNNICTVTMHIYIFLQKKQGYGKFNRDIQGTAKTGTF